VIGSALSDHACAGHCGLVTPSQQGNSACGPTNDRPRRVDDFRHISMRDLSTVDILGPMELRPPSYFALAALIDGPLHGYAIVRRAAELSDGAVRLSTGTLYALLDRAIDAGLVVAGDPYVTGGRTRRDYALTQAGRGRLDTESQRLLHASRVVVRRLGATSALATQ
jgi:PadR family transcriptional regulator PadR